MSQSCILSAIGDPNLIGDEASSDFFASDSLKVEEKYGASFSDQDEVVSDQRGRMFAVITMTTEPFLCPSRSILDKSSRLIILSKMLANLVNKSELTFFSNTVPK